MKDKKPNLDMFADPEAPAETPEFMAEIYESMKRQGVKPEDLPIAKNAAAYKAWLDKNQ